MPKNSAACLASLFLILGCSSSAPDKPKLSPEASAAQAISEYDTNSDGLIDETEAAGAPGLKAAFAKIDQDGDNKVSEQEIIDRINYYKTATSWVINGQVRIIHKGRPLEGATVTFEPESFLGESFTTCTGITDARGEASLSGVNADIPGIFLGFYRVKVNRDNQKGNELIPAKYNEETELGFEANNDVPEHPDMISFNLK